jgi:hypothetical protein
MRSLLRTMGAAHPLLTSDGRQNLKQPSDENSEYLFETVEAP